MVRINKVSWGKVKVNDQPYYQVLIIGNQVEERKKDQLYQLFNTTHEIGDWEQEKLLSGKPEIVLIASGWSGVLKVKKGFKKKAVQAGIKLEVGLTPKIVKKYHQLIKEGKKVNALIHTTC